MNDDYCIILGIMTGLLILILAAVCLLIYIVDSIDGEICNFYNWQIDLHCEQEKLLTTRQASKEGK